MGRKRAMQKHKKKNKNGKKKPVEFALSAIDAVCVSVAGDFNQWNPELNPLHKGGAGVWSIKIKLSPGQYQYRFFVDGEWQNDPECVSFVENPFGAMNCLRVVQ
ncbi:MAG: isoamylase early set domain-containing protein [Deltaproteobacteria bacterium]|nr:isoamylase early set domain-containing protein [Deltaproteobacteria bacterium]